MKVYRIFSGKNQDALERIELINRGTSVRYFVPPLSPCRRLFQASRRLELNQRLLGVKLYRYEVLAYSSVSASPRLYALAIQCIRP